MIMWNYDEVCAIGQNEGTTAGARFEHSLSSRCFIMRLPKKSESYV